MREITKEAEIDNQGNLLLDAFKHAKRAKPATKLVFYEGIVANFGAILAIIGISVSLFIGFRVGYDNMVRLIGVAARVALEKQIVELILAEPCVVDNYKLRVMQ